MCTLPGPFDDADGLPGQRHTIAPSEAQVNYAQRLAFRNDVELPHEVEISAEACSSFIDEQLQSLPPTPKQVEYAKVLANNHNLPKIPDQALESMYSISSFIEAHKSNTISESNLPGPGPGPGPTTKQIIFMASLAQKQRKDIPYDALSSKQGASSFIEQLLATGDQTQSSNSRMLSDNLSAKTKTATPTFSDDDIPF